MIDPFATLGLPLHASPDEVRARYLQLVRENPPDRAPERFAAIRAAYDELRDPARQLADQLFTLRSHESLAELRRSLQDKLATQRPSLDALLALADHV